MRIKLLKLHSSPEIFKPIEFQDGINLIMGEKVETDNVKKGKKTNGVGKSLSVEFINFCLLKTGSNSRVMKIPFDKFSDGTQIILDLEINSQNLRIIRTKGNPENPTIIKDGKSIDFSNLDDANQYLGKILFSGTSENVDISFREFLGPFLREEGSEFKDIMMCYESNSQKTIPPAIKPSAFIFGLDVSLINKIQKKFKEIEKISTHKTALKKSLTENGTKKVGDVKATLNSLNDDLKKIDTALESFKTNEAYSLQQEDLTKIQIEIDDLRSHQSALRYQLRKMRTFPALEAIKEKDIEIIYNQFKSGLGDIVSKSIEEVVNFKQKIDEFQRKLFNEKIKSISEELEATAKKLQALEDGRLSKLEIIDQKGILKDVKNGFAIYHQKRDSYSSIQVKYVAYENTEKELKDLKLEKDKYFQELDALIFEAKKIIDSFNITILSIHEYIMDSNEASFDIKTVTSGKSKKVLSFEMRIDDDGSHSVDRTKVFIYDLALLFNEYTQVRHPHFLVHDNIFDVDQDSLVKSLNYLAKKESQDFQYILTLNRDKIENEEREKMLNLEIDNHRVANFTKESRFLFGEKYSEI
ncbi:MAG: DUF2326 domain-containing protein [Candidatus Moranbacteria bacterium]|nr:DUF2326 domain-containing protein [Candidatus Moranbacteria bacterium]